MSKSFTPVVRVRELDANGNPLAGGKLYTYRTGTSTPKTTYADQAGTPNSNPVILDSEGYADVYLDTDDAYRFRLTDAAGVLRWQRDGVTGSPISTSVSLSTIADLKALNPGSVSSAYQAIVSGYRSIGDGGGGVFAWDSSSVATDDGGTVIAPTGATTGRWKRVYSGPVSIAWFGAYGDGTHDDSAALSSALAAFKPAYVPRGMVCMINTVSAINATILGPGTLKKIPGTDGPMLSFTGTCRVDDGIFLDYDYPNAKDDLNNQTSAIIKITCIDTSGSHLLTVGDATFYRSLCFAIQNAGASLKITGKARFLLGAPHNNPSNTIGVTNRPTYYIWSQPTTYTSDEQLDVEPGALFIGSQTSRTLWHVNPCGFFSTNTKDGSSVPTNWFRTIKIIGATFLYCGHNAGGNYAGPIDTYDGATHVVISDSVMKFHAMGLTIQNTQQFAVVGNVITDCEGAYCASPALANGIIATDRIRGQEVDRKKCTIIGNVVDGAYYAGINASCDEMIISGNSVGNVQLAGGQGIGIVSVGNNVVITGNSIRDPCSSFIAVVKESRLDHSGATVISYPRDVLIADNVCANSSALADAGILVNGDTGVINGIKIRGNTLDGGVASGTTAIYALHAAYVDVSANYINNFNNGVVVSYADHVMIGMHQFGTIASTKISAATSVTDARYADQHMRGLVSAYNPPSLSSGGSTVIQTLAVTGAELGDICTGSVSIDSQGIVVIAWVSAADTVSWYLYNPTSGSIDLGSLNVSIHINKQV